MAEHEGLADQQSLPSALGFGPWSNVQWFGNAVLESIDHLSSNLMLPLAAIMIALFAGWVWKHAKALVAAGLHAGLAARAWRFSLRYLSRSLIFLVVLGTFVV